MNNMSFYVWMLPIVFMLHDFEEIIMAEVWGKRYHKKINAVWPNMQPFGLKYVQNWHTPTFSIQVCVLFLLFSVISLFSSIFQNYFLWFGALLGVTLHMVFIHMFICIRFKHYVPGVITSILFLPLCIWVIFASENALQFDAVTILLACLTGVVLTAILMPALHKLMGPISQVLSNYSSLND